MSKRTIENANEVGRHLHHAAEEAKPLKDKTLERLIKEAADHLKRKLDPRTGG